MCPRVFGWHNPEFRLIFHLSVNIWDINHLTIPQEPFFSLSLFGGGSICYLTENPPEFMRTGTTKMGRIHLKNNIGPDKGDGHLLIMNLEKKNVTGWSLPAPSQRTNPRMCLNFNSKCSKPGIAFEFPSAWEKEKKKAARRSNYSFPLCLALNSIFNSHCALYQHRNWGH